MEAAAEGGGVSVRGEKGEQKVRWWSGEKSVMVEWGEL